MNSHSAFSLLLPLTLIISCSSPSIKLSHDFDRGSIGIINEGEPGLLKANTKHWLKRDSIGDQYYWFYFKADQVKDKMVSFELYDLIGNYRKKTHVVYTDYTQPVYSYDQQNWERIKDVKYDSALHTFQFSQRFIKEPVWIAYAHPYPTSRLKSVIDNIKTSEFVQIENIAKTDQGRNVTLIKITDTQVPDHNKRNILILALQHAGEDAGGYMAEGLINFLVSDAKEAVKARELFNYIIVPMMNPDGTYNGTSRYNMQMEDLNSIWLNDNKAQPEVTGVKEWEASWNAGGNRIDLFIDIHNHSQKHKENRFIFPDHSLDSLAIIMCKHWPFRAMHSEFKGSSNDYFNKKGISSGTVELSQSHLADGKYLEIEDYLSFGKGIVVALNEYFESP
jgi:hypothetical protein